MQACTFGQIQQVRKISTPFETPSRSYGYHNILPPHLKIKASNLTISSNLLWCWCNFARTCNRLNFPSSQNFTSKWHSGATLWLPLYPSSEIYRTFLTTFTWVDRLVDFDCKCVCNKYISMYNDANKKLANNYKILGLIQEEINYIEL